MSKAKNYRFYNLPKEYCLRDYNDVVENVIEKYSETCGLTSIYSWGNISSPGISDIDIIFVFDAEASRALDFQKRSFYFLNEKARYLVRHPFIFIDRGSFSNIRYVYPDADFKLLYGKNIKINKISPLEHFYSRVALLNDIIIRHYPRDFIEQSVNKSINARDTLLRLNSLRHGIKILEDVTKEKNRQWNYKLGLIEKLRKDWFELNDFELLVLLNEDATAITMEITERFAAFLVRSMAKITACNDVKYKSPKNSSLFKKKWGKADAFNEMSNTIKNRQRFYSILPIGLSAQLVEYSRHGGLVSGHIRRNLSNNINYQLKHKSAIGQRIKIFNMQAGLASVLRHSDFAAFFDFGYRNKTGINNWILNLADKARF